MNGLAVRVNRLVAAFDAIGRTRMRGVPVINPALRVEGVGFDALGGDEALGVLVTPWFMNLVRLPLVADDSALGIGRTTRLDLHGRSIDFIGAHEPGIGAFAACSLYSPMHAFRRQADAVDVALAVLRGLRQEPPPARRRFLLGAGSPA